MKLITQVFSVLLNVNPLKAMAATFVTLSCIASCSKPVAEESTESYVHTAAIENIQAQTSYTVVREYIGKLAATQQTNLSFEYPGRVIKINKDSGDTIEVGEVLAQMDDELLNIKAFELKTQIQQVDAQLSLNQANLARANELIKDQYASKQYIDELIAERAILTSKRSGLNASYDALSYQIAKTELRAPYAGVIFQRYISEGDNLGAGQLAFSLVQQSKQQISLGVPADIAENLSIGQSLAVNVNQQQFQAKITAIGQQLNQETRTVNVRLTMDNSLLNVSGLIARVSIKQEISEPGFWVPLTALTDGVRGQWNIYTAEPAKGANQAQGQYQITPQTVKVLHTTQEQAFISGLSGESLSLISQGLHRYVPGQLIKAAGAK
ncbi:efflux RND transporter periplasmic adaptor subunit [Colwellia sp. MEBiC06753]